MPDLKSGIFGIQFTFITGFKGLQHISVLIHDRIH